MGNQACGGQDLCQVVDQHRNRYRQQRFIDSSHKKGFHINSSKISQDYIILHPAIGKGSFGSVYKGINRVTNITRAIKRIVKKGKNVQQLQQILILKKLDHPNVIRIYQIYSEEFFIYIVMEYCNGGQLFDRIIDNNCITENMSKYYMKQLLSAMVNCHSNKIMHRDLKPQNIMFLDQKSNQIKIIDFGAGTLFADNQSENLKIGSIYYIAPEVIKKQYNNKCDIWSLGVILYIMLSGTPPFNGKNDKAIYSKILQGNVNFPDKKWIQVSQQAKDLVQKMLEYNPQRRISARQALLHPWILGNTKQGNKNLYIVNEMQAMKQYSRVNKFQSAVISFISYNLVEANSLNSLKTKFNQIDANNDGKISWKQFRRCFLENMPPVSQEELHQMFRNLDKNQSGFIDYTEFVSSALHKTYQQNQALLQKAFNLIDKDNDGYLDAEELEIAFGSTEKQIGKKMLLQADLNGDQMISRQQFKKSMKNINIKDKTTKQGTKSTRQQ